METTVTPLRRELDERLNQLTPAQQLLQMANDLLQTSAAPWWERLTRTISVEDAAIMEQASLDCRPIEPDTTPTW